MTTRLYQIVKTKRISPAIFNDFIRDNNINIEVIKTYQNSWGETLLTYAVKYGSNINFLEYLYDTGFILKGNYYEMTPIDICVAYNKNETHQKLLILDWLYSKNIQFNPFYLLVYPRQIISWLRNKSWDIDINKRNSSGSTALHEVSKLFHHTHPGTIYNKFLYTNNSYDAFYLLLEMGCDPNIINNYKNTAIDYCIKNSLINNLNILYYFHHEISKTQIQQLIECNNYFNLIKHTLWLLENYNQLNIDLTKSELENKLLYKIINIQYKTTSYNSDYKSILEDLNNKVFFDGCYNIKMFQIDGNIFFDY